MKIKSFRNEKRRQFYFKVFDEKDNQILRSPNFTNELLRDAAVDALKKNAADSNRYDFLVNEGGRFYFNIREDNGEVIAMSNLYKSAKTRALTVDFILSYARSAVGATSNNIQISEISTPKPQVDTPSAAEVQPEPISVESTEIAESPTPVISKKLTPEIIQEEPPIPQIEDYQPIEFYENSSSEIKKGFDVFQNTATGFHYFAFLSDDGKVLLFSQGYAQEETRDKEIQLVKRNSKTKRRFEKKQTETDRFFFLLKTKNRKEIARSVEFESEETMHKAMKIIIAGKGALSKPQQENLPEPEAETTVLVESKPEIIAERSPEVSPLLQSILNLSDMATSPEKPPLVIEVEYIEPESSVESISESAPEEPAPKVVPTVKPLPQTAKAPEDKKPNPPPQKPSRKRTRKSKNQKPQKRSQPKTKPVAAITKIKKTVPSKTSKSMPQFRWRWLIPFALLLGVILIWRNFNTNGKAAKSSPNAAQSISPEKSTSPNTNKIAANTSSEKDISIPQSDAGDSDTSKTNLPENLTKDSDTTQATANASSGETLASGNCDCQNVENMLFKFVPKNKMKNIQDSNTELEFGAAYGLTPKEFFYKLVQAHTENDRDQRYIDLMYMAMGYERFSDARMEHFSETTLPQGTIGFMGYGEKHRAKIVQLNGKGKNLEAFQLKAKNGCDFYFLKSGGNHFFVCPN